jgi:hypothetical protein
MIMRMPPHLANSSTPFAGKQALASNPFHLTLASKREGQSGRATMNEKHF